MTLDLTAVDHICFTVPDLEEAIGFFEEVIGARVVFRRLGPFSAEDEADGGNWMSEQLRVPPTGRSTPRSSRSAPTKASSSTRSTHATSTPTMCARTTSARRTSRSGSQDFDAAYEALLQEERVTVMENRRRPTRDRSPACGGCTSRRPGGWY